MKHIILSALIISTALSCAAAQDTPDTHQSLAKEVLALLSDTELALNSCRDAESVKEALPTFRELAKQAEAIKQKQLALPDSTLQEDITIARNVQDFQMLWEAIRAHIDRLMNENLLSPELRDVLRIAPTTN